MSVWKEEEEEKEFWDVGMAILRDLIKPPVRVPVFTNIESVDIIEKTNTTPDAAYPLGPQHNQIIIPAKNQARLFNANAEAFSYGEGTLLMNQRSYRVENSLLCALRQACIGHHGIALTPDIIYNIVLQGTSTHIMMKNQQQQQQQQIMHVNNTLVKGSWYNDWDASIEDILLQLKSRASNLELQILSLAADTRFSTTTEVEAVAHATVFMNPPSSPPRQPPFTNHNEKYICQYPQGNDGIPFVNVLGQREDWELLLKKLECILGTPDMDMKPWLEKLMPIISNFIAAYDDDYHADAADSTTWWQSIYTCRLDGPAMISGWICQLFPYIHCNYGQGYVKNPMIWDDNNVDDASMMYLPLRRFPIGITSTDFFWKQNETCTFSMKLMTGLVGVTTEVQCNVLQPVLGWVVGDAVPMTGLVGVTTDLWEPCNHDEYSEADEYEPQEYDDEAEEYEPQQYDDEAEESDPQEYESSYSWGSDSESQEYGPTSTAEYDEYETYEPYGEHYNDTCTAHDQDFTM
jgi:hypothetical protein